MYVTLFFLIVIEKAADIFLLSKGKTTLESQTYSGPACIRVQRPKAEQSDPGDKKKLLPQCEHININC